MIIEGIYDGKEVRIVYKDGPCHLYVRHIEPVNLVVHNGFFNNGRLLSAELRSYLSYRDACHFLYTNDVSADNPLWDLNHDGRPSEKYLKEITS